MYSDKTNNHFQPLSNPFDFRHEQLVVNVGVEMMQLKLAVETHGNNFEEFVDDLTTTMRSKANSSQEYFLFKMDVLFGGYLRIKPNEAVIEVIGQLLDAVHWRLQAVLRHEHLYVADRFDYSVQKHSNYGLLFTKT